MYPSWRERGAVSYAERAECYLSNTASFTVYALFVVSRIAIVCICFRHLEENQC